jgi:sec-independent protein translocase protein TatB
MFELDWAKLVVIGVVALIAIGPKELPTVLRTVGQWMGKVRRMAAEFQGQFQEAMREAEMADLKKQMDDINDAAKGLSTFDPLAPAATDARPPTEAASSAPATPSEPPVAGAEAPADAEPPAPVTNPVTAPGHEIAVPLPEAIAPITEKDFAPATEATHAAATHAAATHVVAPTPVGGEAQTKDRPA